MDSVFAKQVLYGGTWYENAYLLLDHGKVHGISDHPHASHVVGHYPNSMVHPGLVDTHIHGFAGADPMSGCTQALEAMSLALLEFGVTSFLPTSLTASQEDLVAFARAGAEAIDRVKGAKIRGLFLEGPWLAEGKAGAQNSAHMTRPDLQALKEWLEAGRGHILKIALAPEVSGAVAMTEYLHSIGIQVGLGHSQADLDQATTAIEAGARILIHTFNGMDPLHHRKPGLIGAGLASDLVYTELIADGHHVHPQVSKILYQVKGSDYVVLVSDATMATALGEGAYTLGEYPIQVEGTKATLADGSLAGSVVPLIDGVRNFVDWRICAPKEALKMASLTPAKSLEIDHLCGQLKAGMDADFIVLDRQLNVQATYIDGVKKYSV